MSADPQLEANKQVALRFLDAINRRDPAAIDAVLHPEFVWNTAVADDDGPNELRPLHSERLKGTNLPHPKPRLNRAEALKAFTGLVSENSGGALKDVMKTTTEPTSQGHMTITVLGITAEGDRVAIEAKSAGIANPVTGRAYGNFYHFLFKVRDGQLVLFKEYQDTLHVYDYTQP
ncbi:nuclear transport factor 2 family protein [Novosphingobium bradum]|uniref:Nuclear transport factor 2 family protein n=1 Tax=Novosphingobium bradum TaxID=1737444 RepID=A0ABV7IL87_9SPHN